MDYVCLLYTSACGVIKNSEVDEETDLKCVFAHGKLKANGDIFEEFYYNMESMTVTKIKPSGKSYTIGDEIPVEGESYQYPDYFDVIVFRDKVAVQILSLIHISKNYRKEYL